MIKQTQNRMLVIAKSTKQISKNLKKNKAQELHMMGQFTINIAIMR